MTAPLLRPYQERLDADIRCAFRAGARRVLGVAPTGSGKTVLFAHITAGTVRKGKRALLLGHRVEIVDQIAGAIARHGIPHGLIAPGASPTDDPIQVASVCTIARRLDHWRDQFDLVVVDEAHHSVSDSWARVLAAFPTARILGVTATPERLDGRGLGDQFDHMVVGPSVAELIAGGFLSPFTIFAPPQAPDLRGVRTRAGDYAVEDLARRMGGVVIQSAVQEYRRVCPGITAVVFCVNIAHSMAVAAAFNAAGIPAAHVDGDTPPDERRAAVAALASGRLQVLCNVSLFGEGVDVPSLGAAILLRPTQSLALHLQQVGRALRPAVGKSKAIILDFAGNTARHGLPDEDRAWSLNSVARKDRPKSPAPKTRRCWKCNAVNSRRDDVCGHCGTALVVHVAPPERRMVLQEAAPVRRDPRDDALAARLRAMDYRARLRWAAGDEGRLRAVARACGYLPGWVSHRLDEMKAAQ